MKTFHNIIFFISVVIWFNCFGGFNQIKSDIERYLTLNYHQGYVLPEYQEFIYLVNDDIHSLEFNISKQTTGNNYWEQLYKYPRFGLSIYYTTLGNDDLFGREIAIVPYIVNHIIERNRFSLDNHIGCGLSYVTKKFDLKNNYRNIAVGSNLNIHFNLKFYANYQLYNKIYLNSGIAFNHLSNGNSREPNIGLNNISLFTGLDYLIGSKIEKQVHEIKPHNPENEIIITYSIGGKHAGTFQSKYFVTSSLSIELCRKAFRKFYFGIGADVFYDASTKINNASDNIEHNTFDEVYHIWVTSKDNSSNNNIYKKSYDYKTGFHISQEFVYHKVSLIVQEGIYAFLTDKITNKKMFNRAIIRYRINNHILINLSMKSHLHILDYPEIGIGYFW